MVISDDDDYEHVDDAIRNLINQFRSIDASVMHTGCVINILLYSSLPMFN